MCSEWDFQRPCCTSLLWVRITFTLGRPEGLRPLLHHIHTLDTFQLGRTAAQNQALKHHLVLSVIREISPREPSNFLYVRLFGFVSRGWLGVWLIHWTWSPALGVFPCIMKQWWNKQLHTLVHWNTICKICICYLLFLKRAIFHHQHLWTDRKKILQNCSILGDVFFFFC